MIFSEQKLRNLNRKYYHGKIRGFDDSKKLYQEFFITTNRWYACRYAGRNGIVEEYNLRGSANIFNMKSSFDRKTFETFCNQYYPYALSDIELMKENDWSGIRQDESYRQSLINIIKDCGYDGFFNYEIDHNMKKELHSYGIYRYDGSEEHYPAIGIFDKGILIKRNEYSINDIIDINDERKFVYDEAMKALAKDPNLSADRFLQREYQRTLVIDEKDIIYIFENFPRERAVSYKEGIKRRALELAKLGK